MHFYADEETEKIAKGWERGKISRVCCKAIKEEENIILTLEVVEKKLSILLQEKNRVNSQVEFLEKTKEKFLRENRQKENSLKMVEEGEMLKRKEQLSNIRNMISDLYPIKDKKRITRLAKEYYNSFQKNEFDSLGSFMIYKGFHVKNE